MVEKRVCFVIMNSFLFSRSSFPAKKNKFWWILDGDIKFSARKSGRSRKKESPASFCIESHVFSLLFKKAQIIFRHRRWWDLWNVVSIVHFGCRNAKLLRATTLNACHLVPTTVGGGGSTVSQKKKYNYPECPWSLLVYWRLRRMRQHCRCCRLRFCRRTRQVLHRICFRICIPLK